MVSGCANVIGSNVCVCCGLYTTAIMRHCYMTGQGPSTVCVALAPMRNVVQLRLPKTLDSQPEWSDAKKKKKKKKTLR
eukprot:NODE_5168_length_423_cov_71.283422_g4495_i0.p1 GENE.NODE_5168_length_423_cov_71.283422_g4495_i0~~NODE_5168_length_423_cov_71.283422_g4495_i0.p1  ORF type:complete len:78 (+),score=17.21 NODE_5168_length_423_cov_71.283422_g4495_i0:186-419(+)